jgi:hypothetical protein
MHHQLIMIMKEWSNNSYHCEAVVNFILTRGNSRLDCHVASWQERRRSDPINETGKGAPKQFI